MGFTLHEISEIMDAWEGNELNSETKRNLITKKLEQIQIKFNDLSQLKISLEAILVKIDQRCDDDLVE
jgi:DNA-binding transcriptional MerR regulator